MIYTGHWQVLGGCRDSVLLCLANILARHPILIPIQLRFVARHVVIDSLIAVGHLGARLFDTAIVLGLVLLIGLFRIDRIVSATGYQ